jgi:hypothetical protein
MSIRRQDFVDDFSIVEYISNRKHVPIKDLIHDLHSISSSLQLELVDLINNDYKQFISLSRNMIGVDTIIKNIKEPLDQVLLECSVHSNNIEIKMNQLQEKISTRNKIDLEISILKIFVQIHESISKIETLLNEFEVDLKNMEKSIKYLERMSIEYNQLEYLLSKGDKEPFVVQSHQSGLKIKTRIVTQLETCLKFCLQKNTSFCFDLFRIYLSMDAIDLGMGIFEVYIIHPFLNNV